MEKLTEWELGIRQAQFEVFHRTWWRKNEEWPEGREPSIGKKTFIGFAITREEAVAMCKEWNDTHERGELSRMAEFESIY